MLVFILTTQLLLQPSTIEQRRCHYLCTCYVVFHFTVRTLVFTSRPNILQGWWIQQWMLPLTVTSHPSFPSYPRLYAATHPRSYLNCWWWQDPIGDPPPGHSCSCPRRSRCCKIDLSLLQVREGMLPVLLFTVQSSTTTCEQSRSLYLCGFSLFAIALIPVCQVLPKCSASPADHKWVARPSQRVISPPSLHT